MTRIPTTSRIKPPPLSRQPQPIDLTADDDARDDEKLRVLDDGRSVISNSLFVSLGSNAPRPPPIIDLTRTAPMCSFLLLRTELSAPFREYLPVKEKSSADEAKSTLVIDLTGDDDVVKGKVKEQHSSDFENSYLETEGPDAENESLQTSKCPKVLSEDSLAGSAEDSIAKRPRLF
ncbi:uncharacterized protein BCR38DRAFT_502055 [Pseudomassariella vexata]|uniref:Uncharacterized protein n=1 Tax=Pseudomassariella vexata TaxID=1141098 RepID=A0A1Y2DE73_9PEZI|nr:uncharacterized protein BCR38DRAFT_502055 [Pseudomassariella vexata]ORY57570.1 hypothetical protein BCR38DRAFT_502055 [Pseudomassariella vexata]